MYMASGVVDVRVTGAVGTIVLNRQERRNALSRAMVAELQQAFDDLHLEKRVRAVVLTGAGTAFCAGLDIHEMQSLAGLPEQEKEQQWGEAADAYRELVAQMIEFPKPIIASVNGPAVAGGAGLVLASDIVVAGEAAQFGLPDPRRGVVAGVVGPLLAFRVGAGPAARLLAHLVALSGGGGVSARHLSRDDRRQSALGPGRGDRRGVCGRGTRGGATHEAAALRNGRRAAGDAALGRGGDQRDLADDRSGPGGLRGVCREAAAGVEVKEMSNCGLAELSPQPASKRPSPIPLEQMPR